MFDLEVIFDATLKPGTVRAVRGDGRLTITVHPDVNRNDLKFLVSEIAEAILLTSEDAESIPPERGIERMQQLRKQGWSPEEARSIWQRERAERRQQEG